jgi:hypothetical protein
MKTFLALLSLISLKFSLAQINIMKVGECIEKNDAKYSENGCFKLFLTNEGDLRINLYNSMLWSTNTTVKGANKACLIGDGNLILATPKGEVTWTSREIYEKQENNFQNTESEESFAKLGEGGDLVVYHNKTIDFSSKSFSACKLFLGPNKDPVAAHKAGVESMKKGKY